MSTGLIRGLHNITPSQKGCVMTIGNMDGVHLGHQALLAETISEARARQVSSLVMTFEPHPAEYFSEPHVTVARLTKLREKWAALATSGIDQVLVLRFNQSLAQLSAQAFISRWMEKMSPSHIVVGDDFRFGYKRQGDVFLLQEMGQQYGFGVTLMPTLTFDHQRISSTRIREALTQGQLDLARQLLGRPYTMQGRVGWGNQLGRQLGFPTINIDLQRALTPLTGIYAVYVHGLSDHPWPGAASIGTRPSVGGVETLLEVHLLDFDKEVYGLKVTIEFCLKLRDEEYFPDLPQLTAQIAKDVEQVRNYFS